MVSRLWRVTRVSSDHHGIRNGTREVRRSEWYFYLLQIWLGSSSDDLSSQKNPRRRGRVSQLPPSFFFFFDSTRVGYVLNIRINCLKGKDQFSFIKIESCSTRKRKSNLRYVAGGIDDFSAWGKQQISIFWHKCSLGLAHLITSTGTPLQPLLRFLY